MIRDLVSIIVDAPPGELPRRVPLTPETSAQHERADRECARLLRGARSLSIHQDTVTVGTAHDARYALNATQRIYSLRSKLRNCGQVGHKCGLALCAVCSTSRASQHRRNLMSALGSQHHGTVLLWTATIASTPGRALRPQWGDLSRVLAATLKGGWLKRRGVAGSARAIEPKRGTEGWHVHAHSLIVFPESKSRDDLRTFALSLRDRFLQQADRLGIDAGPQGQHVRVVTDLSIAVDYITKDRVSANGTNSASRLWASVHAGDAEALELIHEFEAGAFRRRAWEVTGICQPLLDFDDLLRTGALGGQGSTPSGRNSEPNLDLCRYP